MELQIREQDECGQGRETKAFRSFGFYRKLRYLKISPEVTLLRALNTRYGFIPVAEGAD